MFDLESQLIEFAKDSRILGKGPLSVVLVLTRIAKTKQKPYEPADFLSPRRGQVAGLGRTSVQNILKEHGVTRVLAEEGGRTSRGSISIMHQYLALLNRLDGLGILDLPGMEKWWVARIQEFFSAQPIKLKFDSSQSIVQMITDLLDSITERQRECPGTMIAGAVLEHLVGAKLEIALPQTTVKHKSFSVSDASSGARGDFLVEDTVLHVTTAPSEALLRKCRQNIDENMHSIIVTTKESVDGAALLARNAGLTERIDILEAEQFLATNIHEWCRFARKSRPNSIRHLIEVYNRIIDECETDPSLKILL